MSEHMGLSLGKSLEGTGFLDAIVRNQWWLFPRFPFLWSGTGWLISLLLPASFTKFWSSLSQVSTFLSWLQEDHCVLLFLHNRKISFLTGWILTKAVRWPLMKARLLNTWSSDIFWFRAFKRQANAIPTAGTFLSDVLRAFVELVNLVPHTVVTKLYNILAFSLISFSRNFSHEHSVNCTIFFCLKTEFELGFQI